MISGSDNNQGKSVLKSMVERFRYAHPTSREERLKENSALSNEFWWKNQSNSSFSTPNNKDTTVNILDSSRNDNSLLGLEARILLTRNVNVSNSSNSLDQLPPTARRYGTPSLNPTRSLNTSTVVGNPDVQLSSVSAKVFAKTLTPSRARNVSSHELLVESNKSLPNVDSFNLTEQSLFFPPSKLSDSLDNSFANTSFTTRHIPLKASLVAEDLDRSLASFRKLFKVDEPSESAVDEGKKSPFVILPEEKGNTASDITVEPVVEPIVNVPVVSRTSFPSGIDVKSEGVKLPEVDLNESMTTALSNMAEKLDMSLLMFSRRIQTISSDKNILEDIVETKQNSDAIQSSNDTASSKETEESRLAETPVLSTPQRIPSDVKSSVVSTPIVTKVDSVPEEVAPVDVIAPSTTSTAASSVQSAPLDASKSRFWLQGALQSIIRGKASTSEIDAPLKSEALVPTVHDDVPISKTDSVVVPAPSEKGVTSPAPSAVTAKLISSLPFLSSSSPAPVPDVKLLSPSSAHHSSDKDANVSDDTVRVTRGDDMKPLSVSYDLAVNPEGLSLALHRVLGKAKEKSPPVPVEAVSETKNELKSKDMQGKEIDASKSTTVVGASEGDASKPALVENSPSAESGMEVKESVDNIAEEKAGGNDSQNFKEGQQVLESSSTKVEASSPSKQPQLVLPPLPDLQKIRERANEERLRNPLPFDRSPQSDVQRAPRLSLEAHPSGELSEDLLGLVKSRRLEEQRQKKEEKIQTSSTSESGRKEVSTEPKSSSASVETAAEDAVDAEKPTIPLQANADISVTEMKPNTLAPLEKKEDEVPSAEIKKVDDAETVKEEVTLESAKDTLGNPTVEMKDEATVIPEKKSETPISDEVVNASDAPAVSNTSSLSSSELQSEPALSSTSESQEHVNLTPDREKISSANDGGVTGSSDTKPPIPEVVAPEETAEIEKPTSVVADIIAELNPNGSKDASVEALATTPSVEVTNKPSPHTPSAATPEPSSTLNVSASTNSVEVPSTESLTSVEAPSLTPATISVDAQPSSPLTPPLDAPVASFITPSLSAPLGSSVPPAKAPSTLPSKLSVPEQASHSSTFVPLSELPLFAENHNTNQRSNPPAHVPESFSSNPYGSLKDSVDLLLTPAAARTPLRLLNTPDPLIGRTAGETARVPLSNLAAEVANARHSALPPSYPLINGSYSSLGSPHLSTPRSLMGSSWNHPIMESLGGLHFQQQQSSSTGLASPELLRMFPPVHEIQRTLPSPLLASHLPLSKAESLVSPTVHGRVELTSRPASSSALTSSTVAAAQEATLRAQRALDASSMLRNRLESERKGISTHREHLRATAHMRADMGSAGRVDLSGKLHEVLSMEIPE